MPKNLSFFKTITLVIFYSLLISISSCKKDDTTESTPNEEAFTNNFFIYEYWEKIPIDWEDYDTDTILTKGVKLISEVQNGTYEWTINGVPFTTSEIVLDSIPVDSLITVDYKVTKNGETDSLTRNFIRVRECNSLIDGTYRGKVAGSNLTRVFKFSTTSFCKIIRGEGLLKGCAQNFPVSYIGYKQIAFASTTDPDGIGICSDPIGLAQYNTDTKELTVKYRLKSSDNKKDYVFTGSK